MPVASSHVGAKDSNLRDSALRQLAVAAARSADTGFTNGTTLEITAKSTQPKPLSSCGRLNPLNDEANVSESSY